MLEKLVKLGYDYRYKKQPIFADFDKTGHCCIIGGTGSGKSVGTLYFLYNVLKLKEKVELYIGDFKRSKDYIGFAESKNFAEFDSVTNLIERYYDVFESTPENDPTIKLLILDEYASYIVWLLQKDKKKCEDIKAKISNLLMLGRSRHCYIWCITQRLSASLFPSGIGAIDNFQILVGFGRLTVDSRRSLFASEHFDEEFEQSYKPGTGQGLCLIDGQPLYPLEIPRIPDKEKLKKLLRKLAAEKR